MIDLNAQQKARFSLAEKRVLLCLCFFLSLRAVGLRLQQVFADGGSAAARTAGNLGIAAAAFEQAAEFLQLSGR